ncbi:MAG: pyridoxine 5'-phosphate synthase [Nitrospirae bacterium]|nr:pyridoxine 5'-phosphate synthase [Nitrospirota bacterium]
MVLSVNIDHVATLRQARQDKEPDPVLAVTPVILGGADGITVHLREDRRHIHDRDILLLREIVTVPLNLEMSASEEMLGLALEFKPDMVTLVPEKRQELTTEGGLNVRQHRDRLAGAIRRLQEAGIPVSLFINPSLEDVDTSADMRCDMVEIHTGLYSNAKTPTESKGELRKVSDAVARAVSNGLIANAGHGLNYHNVVPIASIKPVSGLYIGHGIVSRALFTGLEEAVREMKKLIANAR